MNITDQSAIFNAFHDGGFLSLRRNKSDIEFQIEIQYLASIVDPTYTYFKGTLINCQQCAFELWGEEKVRYEDIDRISTTIMDMEVSNARVEDNRLYIHCLGISKLSVALSAFHVILLSSLMKEARKFQ